MNGPSSTYLVVFMAFSLLIACFIPSTNAVSESDIEISQDLDVDEKKADININVQNATNLTDIKLIYYPLEVTLRSWSFSASNTTNESVSFEWNNLTEDRTYNYTTAIRDDGNWTNISNEFSLQTASAGGAGWFEESENWFTENWETVLIIALVLGIGSYVAVQRRS